MLVLPRLPAQWPLALLVVVHLPPLQPSLLPAIFGARCRLPVREAEDKAPVEPGAIVFAPPDYHLLVDRGPTAALSADEPVHFSRPSIDVLFESAADTCGAALTAVVFSGASQDGAAGLAAVRRAGGEALVQQPETALVPAMPLHALARCPDARALAPAQIADHLVALGASR